MMNIKWTTVALFIIGWGVSLMLGELFNDAYLGGLVERGCW
jgi:hypothetical protein